MSDSLRDQLLKAGFAKPEPKPKPAKKKFAKHKPKARPHAAPAHIAKTPTTQTEPKAGHTHVPASPPKKKKSKKAPAIKPRAGSWSTRNHTDSTNKPRPITDPVAAEQRRELKRQVQRLIHSTALKNFKGSEIYRFTLQNKIFELQVSEPVRKQLAGGELGLTRLDGSTRVIPASTATEIRAINPQWLVFVSTDVVSADDDDGEHPIPDDLIW